MALRTEHEPEKHPRITYGARDRQYLHAHTGAGVNAHRSVSGRGNGRISSTYKPNYHSSQSASHRHARISAPNVGAVEHPNMHHGQHHGKGDSNSTGKPHTQHQHYHTRLPNGHDRDDDANASAATHPPFNYKTSTTPASQNPDTITITTSHNRTRTLVLVPERPILPPKPRRCIDPVKRAFTNPNLRAILSDKPWPTKRKKAAVEKPVLRMGMRKEYK